MRRSKSKTDAGETALVAAALEGFRALSAQLKPRELGLIATSDAERDETAPPLNRARLASLERRLRASVLDAWVQELHATNARARSTPRHLSQADFAVPPAQRERFAAIKAHFDNGSGNASRSIGLLHEALAEIGLRIEGEGFDAQANERRRRRGIHFTPIEIAQRAMGAALDHGLDLGGERPCSAERLLSLRIIDLAAGTGLFLIAALRELRARVSADPTYRPDLPPAERARLVGREIAERCLFGVDRDLQAIELARIAIELEVGVDPSVEQALASHLCDGDSVLGTADEGRIELEERFSEVFERKRGGFDLVVGNPPFGNGIEERTRLEPRQRQLAKTLYPHFADGPFDVALLFWARGFELLRGSGAYAWLSPTALLSADRRWRTWVHAHYRPTYLELHPVDAFPQARVRTTTFVGKAGRSESVRIVDREGTDGPSKRRELRWPDRLTTWHEAIAPLDLVAEGRTTLALSRICTIDAGCATAAAYELRDWIEQNEEAGGKRLVTTGVIDRYLCRWGEKETRFLGKRYKTPRWPVAREAPASLRRAIARQHSPKIVVGGLTSVIECYVDETGGDAGVVSTWVLRWASAEGAGSDDDSSPKPRKSLHALAALMNSATFSRRFFALHGALAMNGKQTTIKKAALAAMPLPAVLVERRTPTQAPRPLVTALGDEGVALDEIQLLDRVGRAMARDRWRRTSSGAPSDEAIAMDDLGHLLAGRLYGRRDVACFEDVIWFRERLGLSAPATVEAFRRSAERALLMLQGRARV